MEGPRGPEEGCTLPELNGWIEELEERRVGHPLRPAEKLVVEPSDRFHVLIIVQHQHEGSSRDGQAQGKLKEDLTGRARRGIRRISARNDEIRKQLGPMADSYIQNIKSVAPEFAWVNVTFPFGELDTRDVLDLKTRELCTVAALTLQGFSLPQLKVHIHAALRCNASRDEVIEVITQMIAYAGFPAATKRRGPRRRFSRKLTHPRSRRRRRRSERRPQRCTASALTRNDFASPDDLGARRWPSASTTAQVARPFEWAWPSPPG